MHLENLPSAVQLSLALIGTFYLLDRTWTALTQFYYQRQLLKAQPARNSFDDIGGGNSPEFLRQERERNRRQVMFDHANAMIQLMKVSEYNVEIANNAVLEIFRYAKKEADKKYPILDPGRFGIESDEDETTMS